MTTATSLSTRRVQVLFLEKDDDNKKDKDVFTWFSGKVISTTALDRDIKAMIEWDGEYDDVKEKI